MSFLIAEPDLVTAAAGEVAGIRTALSTAVAAASAPTTTVMAAAADEVSAAISQLFGAYGQEFQAFNAQASAFHAEFVHLLNAGATAYDSAELLSAASLHSAVGGLLGAAGNPPAGTLFAAVSPLVAPAAVGSAYPELFANTQTNLQALQTAWSANPAPFLSQVLTNQQIYAQTIAGQLEYTFANLPTVLANVPGDIRAAAQAISAFDPAPYVQQFVNNQSAYANIVSTSLQNAGQSFSTGLQGLPTAFRTAFQDLQTGDLGGAASTLGSGFLNLVFTGFDTVVTPTVPIGVDVYLNGALGDLFPIFAIPGQESQDFTNLLPAGSIPAQMSQNFTHVVNMLTDTTISAKVPNILPQTFKIDADLGMPLALAFQAAGSPVTTVSAVSTSASAFAGAIQSGNATAAFEAVVDAPAVIANGFLNGREIMPVSINIGSGLPAIQLNLPFNGILVPQAPLTATIDWGFPFHTLTYNVGGTQFGGLIPALYGASAGLADAIKPA